MRAEFVEQADGPPPVLSAVERLPTPPFPVYALDARWSGQRWSGGWGRSNDVVTSFTLAHGAFLDSDAPEVRVTTEHPSGSLDALVARMPSDLASELWHATGVLREDVRAAAWSPDDQAAPWERVELTIDGLPVTLRWLSEGEHWVAFAEHGDAVIAITARRWPPEATSLVTVSDLAAYPSPG